MKSNVYIIFFFTFFLYASCNNKNNLVVVELKVKEIINKSASPNDFNFFRIVIIGKDIANINKVELFENNSEVKQVINRKKMGNPNYQYKIFKIAKDSIFKNDFWIADKNIKYKFKIKELFQNYLYYLNDSIMFASNGAIELDS